MNKIIFLLIFSFLVLIFGVYSPSQALAQEKIEIQFFYSTTCPHCTKEKIFLDNLIKKYPEIKINAYEFTSEESQATLEKFYDKFDVKTNQKGLVPATFIGEKYFIGFNEETTGREIENYIITLLSNSTSADCESDDACPAPIAIEEKIKVPFLKEISPDQYSLGSLAAILGFFDGFNICSLGALVLILGIVLAFRSRKKTLLFGLTFILTTAAIYGLLIFVWHRIFLALSPYIAKMEIFIGILALAGAIYFILQFYKTKKYGATCQSQSILGQLSQKLNNIFQKTSSTIVLVLAVLLFAAIITIIEFPCSAVLPVLFASIISEANISTTASYFYIGVFLFFYMLDELIVFLIAFFTLKVWIASPKFNIWLNFAAFIILSILAFYYLLI